MRILLIQIFFYYAFCVCICTLLMAQNYIKMKTLAEKIKKITETPYQMIAKEFHVHTDYVGKIARGARKAERGKALQIKLRLEELTH